MSWNKKTENKDWHDQLADFKRIHFPSFKDKMINGFEKFIKPKKEYEQLHESK